MHGAKNTPRCVRVPKVRGGPGLPPALTKEGATPTRIEASCTGLQRKQYSRWPSGNGCRISCIFNKNNLLANRFFQSAFKWTNRKSPSASDWKSKDQKSWRPQAVDASHRENGLPDIEPAFLSHSFSRQGVRETGVEAFWDTGFSIGPVFLGPDVFGSGFYWTSLFRFLFGAGVSGRVFGALFFRAVFLEYGFLRPGFFEVSPFLRRERRFKAVQVQVGTQGLWWPARCCPRRRRRLQEGLGRPIYHRGGAFGDWSTPFSSPSHLSSSSNTTKHTWQHMVKMHSWEHSAWQYWVTNLKCINSVTCQWNQFLTWISWREVKFMMTGSGLSRTICVSQVDVALFTVHQVVLVQKTHRSPPMVLGGVPLHWIVFRLGRRLRSHGDLASPCAMRATFAYKWSAAAQSWTASTHENSVQSDLRRWLLQTLKSSPGASHQPSLPARRRESCCSSDATTFDAGWHWAQRVRSSKPPKISSSLLFATCTFDSPARAASTSVSPDAASSCDVSPNSNLRPTG